MVVSGKWKCSVCLLMWDKDAVQCKACESFKPGLSEAEIAEMKAEQERRRKADIAKFVQPSTTVKPTGFAFGAFSAPAAGITFGAAADPKAQGASGSGVDCGAVTFGSGAPSTSAPVFTFGLGAPLPPATSSAGAAEKASAPALALSFGSGAPFAPTPAQGFGVFGSLASPGGKAPAVSFGFNAPSAPVGAPAASSTGSATGAGNAATWGLLPPQQNEKALDKRPAWPQFGRAPVGDVFVHGSGECDQLGLGDAQRERKKPTIIKALSGKQVFDLAVGALHVVCVTTGGAVYSWGCNDDGALGRLTDQDATPDCEPHLVPMPPGTAIRQVACGDNHTCALDTIGRVWLWGTYKDSNGHIGIARKRKQGGAVADKSSEPDIVLEGCHQIASGANHTVAWSLGSTKFYTWGSNGTGQLGLPSGEGCGLEEREVAAATLGDGKWEAVPGGGTTWDRRKVVRILEASGAERSALTLSPGQVQQAILTGATALVLELPEREVPKSEKQRLLVPQEVSLTEDVVITGIFASAECTFITVKGGAPYGCGLNGDGQVGLGFMCMAVRTFRRMRGPPQSPSWMGGGLHSTAALVGGEVYAWGQADECGHGLGPGSAPILEPRRVEGLPRIRTLRCGGNHMLACSEAGDAYLWGCGLTYQLANRPRDVANSDDADEDPTDELRPYRLSSKQLETRYILLADGGAQHSVELAWDGSYGDLPKAGEVALASAADGGTSAKAAQRSEVAEPPSKRRAMEERDAAMAPAEEVGVPEADLPAATHGHAAPAAPQLAADAEAPPPSDRQQREAGAGSEIPSAEPSLPEAPPASSMPQAPASSTLLLRADLTGKWKCSTCFLAWDKDVVQCKACESFNPSLSEADIAEMKAEQERRRQADIAKFLQPSSTVKPTGFAFGQSGTPAASVTFGAAVESKTEGTFAGGFGSAVPTFGFGAAPFAPAPAVSFGFGAPPASALQPGPASAVAAGSATSAQSSTAPVVAATQAPTPAPAFTFGFGTPSASTLSAPSFGSPAGAAQPGGKATAAFSFGFNAPSTAAGPSASSTPSATRADQAAIWGMPPALRGEKALDKRPSWPQFGSAPVGDVFVHGSGECDQLGLGDAHRERRKPTLVKPLCGKKVFEIAVGALHVACVTTGGTVYTWGCNDDGALGRPTDQDAAPDCEPHLVPMPSGTAIQRVTCGDNHTCALDTMGRVWLWGTYKDSNGHIGIARKRKQGGMVADKSSEPDIVLEGCCQISSGANHTVALSAGARNIYTWGSNGTGQLGLSSGEGCGLDEWEVAASAVGAGTLQPAPGGGTTWDHQKVVRIRESSGTERSALTMSPDQVQQAILSGANALIMELPEREVPKSEKQKLLVPQEVSLGEDVIVTGVFASAECTFVTVKGGAPYGCGLNGDGQVGLGFLSMAVRTFRRMRGPPRSPSWMGGGLHSTAALVGDEVYAWGQADECGHGLGPGSAPILEPRRVEGLPGIRTLRCGGNHMLACSEAGDAYLWGCGLTYQLANRPRDVAIADDADEDPADELRPYRLSSKQLETRYILLADGGAQHSVELAWDGTYAELPKVGELALAGTREEGAVAEAARGAAVDEPPSKRRATEERGVATEERGITTEEQGVQADLPTTGDAALGSATAAAPAKASNAPASVEAQHLRQQEASAEGAAGIEAPPALQVLTAAAPPAAMPQVQAAPVVSAAEVCRAAAASREARARQLAREEARLMARVEAEVLRYFSGTLWSEAAPMLEATVGR